MFEARVQRQYDAMNRHDLAAVMGAWALDGVWEFPGNTPMSGRFVGKPAIQDWFERWMAHFTDVQFTVRHVAVANPLAFNVANTMFVAWDVKLRTVDGVTAAGSGITLLRLRRGKTTFGRDYVFDTELLELVWGRRVGSDAVPANVAEVEEVAVRA